MAQVYVPVRSRLSVSIPIPDYVFAFAVLLLIAFLTVFGIRRLNLANQISFDAPASEFSSDRAMQDLHAIAGEPRPMGSAAHNKVRDYIVERLVSIGLKPEIQKTTVVHNDDSIMLSGATVQNIVARLTGMENSKAVMLMAHYDSMPNSLGASDDGSAVVAMIETARALLASAPLKNDVIFLFTDCEEAGLMGARAFVSEHPWASDVGLALNFDALGTGGPLILFETGNQNGWVIQEFAKAATDPLGNSLANEIYRITPLGTDLDVFKEAGYAGLNFAYVDRPTHHHVLSDSIENMDQRTLQQIGTHALGLTRHFGSLDLQDISKPDAVYFDVYRMLLIHYPNGAALALAIFLVLAFVGVAVLGFKRRKLSLSGVGLGSAAFLTSMIVGPLIIAGIWVAIWMVNGRPSQHSSGLFMAGFVALTIAITAGLYMLFEKKITIENLAFGALFCWLLLAVFTAIYLPGGSYLFSWPLLFSLAGLAVMFAVPGGNAASKKRLALISIFSAPALMLFVPLIYLTYTTLGLGASGPIMVAVVILLGTLVPQVGLVPAGKKWLVQTVLALAGFVMIVTGSLTSGYNQQNPKQNDIFYVVNADSGKAVWASYDHSPDEWTSQFLTLEPQRGPLADYLPSPYRGFLSSAAPVLSLEGPNAILLSDVTAGNTRTCRLRITSGRKAPVITLFVYADAPIPMLMINGKRLPDNPRKSIGIIYFGLPPEGVEMTVETEVSNTIKIRAIDQSYELPEFPNSSFKQRPLDMVPAVVPYSDMTLVSKSFKF